MQIEDDSIGGAYKRCLFSGDTLFIGGCGRYLQGSGE